MKIQDGGIYENKIGVELIKEAATESELNSIYVSQLIHDVDQSLVLTLIVVCILVTMLCRRTVYMNITITAIDRLFLIALFFNRALTLF